MFTIVVQGPRFEVSSMLDAAGNVDYEQVLPPPPFLLWQNDANLTVRDWQRACWNATEARYSAETSVREEHGTEEMMIRFKAPAFPTYFLQHLARVFPDTVMYAVYTREWVDHDVREQGSDNPDANEMNATRVDAVRFCGPHKHETSLYLPALNQAIRADAIEASLWQKLDACMKLFVTYAN